MVKWKTRGNIRHLLRSRVKQANRYPVQDPHSGLLGFSKVIRWCCDNCTS